MANIKALGGFSVLQEQVAIVKNNISLALAHRQEEKVTGQDVILVGVTKNHPVDIVEQALAIGIYNIGENRVQEAKSKHEVLKGNGCWHLIGHLQTNKVKQAVEIFDIIESVDSERVLSAIDNEAGKLGKTQRILIQINVAQEEQKSGFSVQDYRAILPKLTTFENIECCGVMVIAPVAENPETVRPVFAQGYALFKEMQKVIPNAAYLSMGMTHDYMVAIEEGANIIRVGTALFGARDYSVK